MVETHIERPRIAWLDFLRGVGISLVVVGHCLSGGCLRAWIYNFHVPLLFMLSGYLNQKLHDGSKRIRIRRILLPYVIWAILSTAVTCVLKRGDCLFVRWLTDVIPVSGFTNWNAPLWFLYALFFVDVLKPVWFLDKSVAGAYKSVRSCFPMTLFAVVVACVAMLKPEWHNVLAWKNIVFGIVCYCIGEAISHYKIIERLDGKIAIVIALFVVGSCIGLYNGGLSIYGCSYGRSIYLLAVASVFMSISLMALFRHGENYLPEWLSLLGRCSLFIMVSHYFILYIAVRLICWLGVSNTLSQTVAGLIMVSIYLFYFKLLAMTHLQSRIPDYLGGYVLSRDLKRDRFNG